MWGLKGQELLVPAAGRNRRAPVFGGLDAQTGKLTILLTERKRGAEFIAFLKLLLRRYAGRHVFLFLDNCSIHHSRLVERFLADHKKDLTVIWNAPYTPELNLIERYWGHLKAKALNNHLFSSLDELKAAIRDAVTRMNRSENGRQKLHLSALQSLLKTA